MYFQRYCFVLSENSELLKRDSSVWSLGGRELFPSFIPKINCNLAEAELGSHDEEYPLKKLGAGVK